MKQLPFIEDWHGQFLDDEWLVTLKLNGIPVFIQGDKKLSRLDEPLYNIPNMPNGIYEVYLGSWEASMSATATHHGEEIKPEQLYRLDIPDKRIIHGNLINPSKRQIVDLLKTVNKQGYEGLVFRQRNTWIKVKSSITIDTPITKVLMGYGIKPHLIGSLETKYGAVSSGMEYFHRMNLDGSIKVGAIIEVSIQEWTPYGKWRIPKFIRVRRDKHARDVFTTKESTSEES